MAVFKVSTTDANKRTDHFVVTKYRDFSRSALEQLFDKDFVKVNGESAKAGRKLRAGDKVSVQETLLKAKPPKIDLPVTYEDQDVIVINKPVGILAHSKGALNTEATVASFIAPRL